jgi:hypothetical protein
MRVIDLSSPADSEHHEPDPVERTVLTPRQRRRTRLSPPRSGFYVRDCLVTG